MILIEHKFVCDECGASEVKQWEHHLGDETPRPYPPSDWTEFQYQVFCGKHTIHARITKAKPGEPNLVWHRRPKRKTA